MDKTQNEIQFETPTYPELGNVYKGDSMKGYLLKNTSTLSSPFLSIRRKSRYLISGILALLHRREG